MIKFPAKRTERKHVIHPVDGLSLFVLLRELNFLNNLLLLVLIKTAAATFL
jgi:hypothetical protein